MFSFLSDCHHSEREGRAWRRWRCPVQTCVCLFLKGSEWLPFYRARWAAEMESEIPAYFSLAWRRKMTEQKCSRKLCALCRPEKLCVLCVLFTYPEDRLFLHLLALTLLSGLFLSIPFSDLCWDREMSLSFSAELISCSYSHYTTLWVFWWRKAPSALCMQASSPVHAYTCVGGRVWDALSAR